MRKSTASPFNHCLASFPLSTRAVLQEETKERRRKKTKKKTGLIFCAWHAFREWVCFRFRWRKDGDGSVLGRPGKARGCDVLCTGPGEISRGRRRWVWISLTRVEKLISCGIYEWMMQGSFFPGFFFCTRVCVWVGWGGCFIIIFVCAPNTGNGHSPAVNKKVHFKNTPTEQKWTELHPMTFKKNLVTARKRTAVFSDIIYIHCFGLYSHWNRTGNNRAVF